MAVALITLAIIFVPKNTIQSVLGTDGEVIEGVTCEADIDCYDNLISLGFPRGELDAELNDYDLICRNSACEVSAK